MIAVIDTNVLVSGMWSNAGFPNAIVTAVIAGEIVIPYDHRTIAEYKDVLQRPLFKISKEDVAILIGIIQKNGLSLVPTPMENSGVSDPDDIPFYELAKFCNCPLVTGNIKDYPKDKLVMTPKAFVEGHLSNAHCVE